MSKAKLRVDYIEKPEHEWEQPYEVHEVVFANEFIIVTTYECCFAMWTSSDVPGDLISGALWKKGREFVARAEVERFYRECGALPFVGEFDRTFWEHIDKRAAEGAWPASSAPASRILPRVANAARTWLLVAIAWLSCCYAQANNRMVSSTVRRKNKGSLRDRQSTVYCWTRARVLRVLPLFARTLRR